LQKVNPDVRLLLVGNYEANLDPVKPEAKALMDNTPSIEAVGPQYGGDLKSYYAASDCFVPPSNREGFPNTVMEASAMDLPSIVTDINGCREIIKGENGMIIPSKDADALYSAMLRMATDTTTTQCMACSASKLITSRFEQGFVRDCLYDFYQEIKQ
jgi:glycosyltransferase involved in cell wall biosynthesis